MKTTNDQMNWNEFFNDMFTSPDIFYDYFDVGKSLFSVYEEELDKLFIEQNLQYFVRLSEIKKEYKVLRNSSGKHKIRARI